MNNSKIGNRIFYPGSLFLIVFLSLMASVGSLSIDIFLPSLPDMARYFHVDNARIQLTLSLFLIGYATSQLFYGPAADRLGRRPVLIFVWTLYSLSGLFCIFSSSFSMLMIGRCLQALSAGGPIVVTRAIVRDMFEENAIGLTIARMSMVVSIVPALAPVIGGQFQALWGWRSSFIFVTCISFIMLLLTIAIMPETLKDENKDNINVLSFLKKSFFILKKKVFIGNLFIASCIFSTFFSFVSGAPFIFRNDYGLSPQATGHHIGGIVIGFFSGAMLTNFIISRYGSCRIMKMGAIFIMIGGGFGMSVISFRFFKDQLPFWISIMMGIHCFGAGLSLPQAIGKGIAQFSKLAGTASSLIGFFQYFFAACAGIFVGDFVARDIKYMTLTVVVFSFAASAMIFLMSGVNKDKQ